MNIMTCSYPAWNPVPLTNAQLNVYLDQMTNEKSTAYNILTTLAADGSVSDEQIISALQKIVEAHPVLSACVEQKESGIYLKKGAGVAVIPVEGPEQADLHVRMDLFNGPLTYFYLFRKDSKRYVAAVTHHIIFDGRSIKLLEEAFGKALKGEALAADTEFLLAAEAEKPRLTSEYQKACLDCFDTIFDGVEEIPRTFKVDDGQSGCIMVRMPIAPDAVKAFAEKHRIKESVFFQSVFALVYAAFTGNDKAVFCITDNGRRGLAGFDSFGMYVRNIPVCIRIPDGSVADFLSTASETISNARKMSDIPFYMLKKRYGVDGAVVFNYMADFAGISNAMEEVTLFSGEKLSNARNDSISDIDFYVCKADNDYVIRILHSENYNDDYALSLVETFRRAAEELMRAENIRDIEYTGEETLALYDRINRTDTALRFPDVIDALTFFAANKPGNIALRHKDKAFTYAELAAVTDSIALALRQAGAAPGDRIAVHVPVSEWYLICSLAVLKLGCVYVPMNTKHPASYKQGIVDRVSVKIVLCTEATLEDSRFEHAVCMNAEEAARTEAAEKPVFPAYAPGDAATILFTSGSTGEAKAVALTRGGYANLCDWISQYVELKENEAFGMYQTYTFCSHIDPMFSPLFCGAAVDIIPDEIRFELEELNQYFIDHNVTVMKMGAAIGRQFIKQIRSTPLRVLGLGGEKLGRIFEKRPYRIVDLYGQTENTVHTTAVFVDEKSSFDNIGTPIFNNRVYVLNRFRKRMPLFAEGTLWCSGAGVSLGYLGNEALTKQSFTDNPFTEDPAHRVLFNSGDIARFLPDGSLSFIGRRDFQIKVRGNRVETAEVAACIREMPEVDDVTVQPYTGESDTELAAYVVLNPEHQKRYTPRDLFTLVTEYILKRKPDYMVPTYVMELEAIPLNINGKLDRKALPRPEANSLRAEYAAPRTGLEARICAAFEKILGVDRVGLDDDFVHLGGDSLNAIKMLGVLKGTGVKAYDILSCATPRKIAAAVTESEAVNLSLDGYTLESGAPLSQSQLVMYLDIVASGKTDAYVLRRDFAAPETCTAEEISRAIARMADIHPILRSCLRDEGGEPRLMTNADAAPEILVADTAEEGKDFLQAPFDLKRSLARFLVVKSGNRVFLALHHLIADMLSMSILEKHIIAALAGEALPAREANFLKIPRFAELVRDTQDYAEAKSFFAGMLADLEECNVMIHDKYGKGPGEVTAPFSLNPLKLERLIRRSGSSKGAFFASVFAYTMSRFVASDKVQFTAAYEGRDRYDAGQSVGLFASGEPVLFDCAADTVESFLQKNSKILYSAFKYDFYNIFEIKKDFFVNEETLFQFIPRVSEYLGTEKAIGAENALTYRRTENANAETEFLVYVFETDSGYVFRSYHSAAFSEEKMTSFAKCFVRLAEQMLDAEALAELSLVSEEETRFLDRFNETDRPLLYPDFLDAFAHHVKERPDNLCASCEDEKYTYAEVDRISDYLANRLTEAGIRKGDAVAMLPHRSAWYVIDFILALKMGTPYIPIDTALPKTRIGEMLADAKAKAVLMTGNTAELAAGASENMPGLLLFEQSDEIVRLALEANETFEQPPHAPEDDAAYVYTSGTTGKPKGVRVRRLGIINLAQWYLDTFHPTDKDIISMPISIGFVPHLYMTHVMIAGGAADITPDWARFDVAQMNKYFTVHGVTHTGMAPPSLAVAFFGTQHNETLVANHTGGARIGDFDPRDNKCVTFGGYGTSETSGCTLFTYLDKRMENDCLGYPTHNHKAFILDNCGRRLPLCAVGQLCISGNGVSGGYLNDEAKTAAAFLPNPYANGDPKYARMYRTGDYGCVFPDGSIFNAGRVDRQVKINGNRIELSEIEELLAYVPFIAGSTVQAVRINGTQMLCAYVVLRPGTEMPDAKLFEVLRAHIGKFKPAYMVPSFVIRLDKLPLNLNGKLDKSRLPAPDPDLLKSEYVAPSTPTEKAVCEAFSSVMNRDGIGVNDDFIRLGGDSLMALRVLSALETSVIKVTDILSLSTPKAIAALIDERSKAVAREEAYTLEKGVPLTFAQMNVCLDEMANDKKTAYRVSSIFEVSGKADGPEISSALDAVFKAYPILSTRIAEEDGELLLLRGVRPSVDFVTDIRDIDFSEAFDTANGPLAHFYILRQDDSYYIAYSVHHAIFDGSSIEAFRSAFERAMDHQPLEKDEAFLRAAAANAKLRYEKDKSLAVFDKVFEGVEEIQKLSKIDDGAAGTAEKDLAIDYGKLKAFVTKLGITEAVFFEAVFSLVYSCFTAEDKAVFCITDNGRDGVADPSSIGMFVHNIPVCIRTEDMPVSDYLRQVFDTVIKARGASTLPFYEYRNRYGVSASVIFQYLPGVIRDRSGLVRRLGLDHGNTVKTGEDSIADIDFYLFRNVEKFRLRVSHSDRFNDAYAKSLIDTFEYVAEQLMSAGRLSEIEYARPEELRFYDRINSTETRLRFDDLIDAFEYYVETTPDAVALKHKDKVFTYAQLGRITDAIAVSLTEAGLKRQDKVAVCVPVSEWYLICSLAVMKAGGVYVPLNTKHPVVYRQTMLGILGDVRYMLCTGETAEEMAESGTLIIRADTFSAENAKPFEIPAVEKEDAASVLFTSGTTGVPKAVTLTRGGYANLCDWISRFMDMTSEDTFGMYQTYTFCSHIDPMFCPLFAGGAVDIIPDEIRFDLDALQKYFIAHNVTLMKMGAAVGRQLVREMKETTIRVLGLGGEQLGKIGSDRPYRIVDLYGQTENTVHTTASWLDEKSSNDNIGYPIFNNKVYILNRFGKRLPVYAEGLMYVTGAGVTKGYNNEKLTKLSFVPNPFSADPDYAVMFNSSDIARYLPDGSISFLGRRDKQVKIRGNRVEPSEVAATVAELDFVKDVTVQVTKGVTGNELAAYIVPAEGCTLSRAEIFAKVRAYVLSKKPEYMAPAYVMLLDAIPLNINGKVDARSLPEVDRDTDAAAYAAPETEMEKLILDMVVRELDLADIRLGTKDNLSFFGLDSLKIIVLLGEFNKQGILMDAKFMLKEPTVAAWARYADEKKAELERRKEEKRVLYPLPDGSLSVYLNDRAISKVDPDQTAFIYPIVFKVTGLPAEKAREAVYALLEAHTGMKAAVCEKEKNVYLVRRDDWKPVIHIRRLDKEPDGEYFMKKVRPMDPLKDDLFTAEIFTWRKDVYVFMTIHHLISDGVSHSIIMNDFLRLLSGAEIRPEAASAYDVAAAQLHRYESGEADEDRKYYENLMAGYEHSDLERCAPRNELGLEKYLYAFEYAGKAVDELCEANGLSVSGFFESALIAALAKVTGNNRVMILAAENGRTESILKNTVAALASKLPVAYPYDPALSFLENAKGIAAQTTESLVRPFYKRYFLGESEKRRFFYNCHAVYQKESRQERGEAAADAELIRLPMIKREYPIPVVADVSLTAGGNYCFSFEIMKALYTVETAENFTAELNRLILDQLSR